MAAVKVLDLGPSPKPNVLARAKAEITFDDGDSIVVDDLRVLRNKQSQLWVAPPSYSIQVVGSRAFEYVPCVVFSTKLRRQVEDAVLAVFDKRQREPQAGGTQ